MPVLELIFFGSRVAGNERRNSDLDVAVDAGRPLTLAELSRLREAFEESHLSVRVDLSDVRALRPEFRAVALRGGMRRAVTPPE